jgi:hypothetical protein
VVSAQNAARVALILRGGADPGGWVLTIQSQRWYVCACVGVHPCKLLCDAESAHCNGLRACTPVFFSVPKLESFTQQHMFITLHAVPMSLGCGFLAPWVRLRLQLCEVSAAAAVLFACVKAPPYVLC